MSRKSKHDSKTKASIRPTTIWHWSLLLMLLYAAVYTAVGATILLGFVMTPQYLSPGFLVISLPILIFSVGLAYGLLARYKGSRRGKIAASALLGLLIYLIAGFLFYTLDGYVTYARYLG